MSTRNIVPRNDNEGQLGTEKKKWIKIYANEISAINFVGNLIGTANKTINDSIGQKIDESYIKNIEINNDNLIITKGNNVISELNITPIIYNKIETAIKTLIRNKIYKVNDIAYLPSLASYIRLECCQEGTTAETTPEEFNSAQVGQYITDGNVKWIVCDIRDGLSLGDVAYRPILKEGYVKLNGATVQRNDYPRLVKYATDNNLWTSSPMTEVWKFGQGDGSTTFVLPDYRNIFLEGGDTPSKIEAGLPNIQGDFYANDISSLFWTGAKQATGAFSLNTTQKNVFSGTATALLSTTSAVLFNASSYNAIYGKSNTVQPPSIKLIPQIKY